MQLTSSEWQIVQRHAAKRRTSALRVMRELTPRHHELINRVITAGYSRIEVKALLTPLMSDVSQRLSEVRSTEQRCRIILVRCAEALRAQAQAAINAGERLAIAS